MIQVFPSGPFSTNTYVFACPKSQEAAVIDPSPGSAQKVLSFLKQNNLNCSKILLTHSHWDHIADVAEIKKATGAPVYIHALDAPNLESPGVDGLPCWFSITPVVPDVLIKEGDVISVGEYVFKVIHTPGHSPGGVCFHDSQHHLLFSGDTLFQGTIGNLSFPTCQANLMWPSLDKLSKLDPKTQVYPGHGPATTIGAESWLPRAEELFGD